jgi:hypothetical protein
MPERRKSGHVFERGEDAPISERNDGIFDIISKFLFSKRIITPPARISSHFLLNSSEPDMALIRFITGLPIQG